MLLLLSEEIRDVKSLIYARTSYLFLAPRISFFVAAALCRDMVEVGGYENKTRCKIAATRSYLFLVGMTLVMNN